MKKTKLLFSSLICAPVTVAPFITSCSCSGDAETRNLVNRINNAFNNDGNSSFGTATDADNAISNYKTNILNTNQARNNEILFACFNFVAKKHLSLTKDTSNYCTPDNKSFYDLMNEGVVQMNSAYNMNTDTIGSDNKFSFQIQGYLNCIYTRDSGSFKAGDYVQFAYDIEATAYAEIKSATVTGSPDKYYMGIDIAFNPADPSKMFGFIKYKTEGTYKQTLSINDMSKVYYDDLRNSIKWGYNRGYYSKA